MRRGVSAACLFSALAAGVITTLASPVTADKTTVVTVSVNRDAKGDRQPLAPPVVQRNRHDSNSPGKSAVKRALPGCERAFSPIVDPNRADILTHCTT
jgi:hypothetical protein